MTTDGSKRMTPREVAHEMQSVLRLGVTHFGAICPTWCDTMTAAIAADRAVETEAERVYREQLDDLCDALEARYDCRCSTPDGGDCDCVGEPDAGEEEGCWVCHVRSIRCAIAAVAALRKEGGR